MELKGHYEEWRVLEPQATSSSSGGVLGKKKPSPASVRQHSLKRLKKAVGFGFHGECGV